MCWAHSPDVDSKSHVPDRVVRMWSRLHSSAFQRAERLLTKFHRVSLDEGGCCLPECAMLCFGCEAKNPRLRAYPMITKRKRREKETTLIRILRA